MAESIINIPETTRMYKEWLMVCGLGGRNADWSDVSLEMQNMCAAQLRRIEKCIRTLETPAAVSTEYMEAHAMMVRLGALSAQYNSEILRLHSRNVDIPLKPLPESVKDWSELVEGILYKPGDGERKKNNFIDSYRPIAYWCDRDKPLGSLVRLRDTGEYDPAKVDVMFRFFLCMILVSTSLCEASGRTSVTTGTVVASDTASGKRGRKGRGSDRERAVDARSVYAFLNTYALDSARALRVDDEEVQAILSRVKDEWTTRIAEDYITEAPILYWLIICASRISPSANASYPRLERLTNQSAMSDFLSLQNAYCNTINSDSFLSPFKTHNLLRDHYMRTVTVEALRGADGRAVEPFEIGRREGEDEYFYRLYDELSKKRSMVIYCRDGYGKSTALKATALACGGDESYFESSEARLCLTARIPFFITLGNVRPLCGEDDLAAAFECMEDIMLAQLVQVYRMQPEDARDLLEHLVSGDSSAAKEGKLLLLIDDIAALARPKDTENPGVTAEEVLCVLQDFCNRYPEVKFVLAATPELYSFIDSEWKCEKEFASVCIRRFHKKTIAKYCRRWYELVAMEHDLAPEWARESAQAACEYFGKSRSVRRIAHCPARLYEILAMAGRTSSIYSLKSPLHIVRRLVNEMLGEFCRSTAGDCDDADLRALLSFLGYNMMDNGWVSIRRTKLVELLRDARGTLAPFLTDRCPLHIDHRHEEYIEQVLKKLPLCRISSDGQGGEEFSFVSRPIHWYFVVNAVRDGMTGASDDFANPGGAALRFVQKHLHECASDGDIHTHTNIAREDWVELIPWMCVSIGAHAGQVVEYLCEQTVLPTVANRPLRDVSARILTAVLAQRPVLAGDIRERASRSALSRTLNHEQRDELNNLLNSPFADGFVQHVYKAYYDAIESSDRCISTFPPYVWCLGYIDYLDLIQYSMGRRAFADQSQSLRIDVLGNANPEEKCKRKSQERVAMLVSAIELQIRRMNGTVSDTKARAKLMRLLAVLATVIWLGAHDKESTRPKGILSQLGLDKERLKSMLIPLISLDDLAVTTILCSAISSMRKMYADIGRMIDWNMLIRADAEARLLYSAYFDREDSQTKLRMPLNEPLKLLATTHIVPEDHGKCDFSEYNGGQVITLYRQLWEYISLPDEQKKPFDREARSLVLMFKLMFLCAVFTRQEACAAIETIRSAAGLPPCEAAIPAIRDGHKVRSDFVLPTDELENFLLDTDRIYAAYTV